MAEFTLDTYFKPSLPSLEMHENMTMNQFGEPNPTMLENFNITDSLVENFLGYHYQPPEYPQDLSYNFPGTSHSFHLNEIQAHTIDLTRESSHESKKIEPSQTGSEDVCSTASAKRSKDKKKKNVCSMFLSFCFDILCILSLNLFKFVFTVLMVS